jgi:hypothetical protein
MAKVAGIGGVFGYEVELFQPMLWDGKNEAPSRTRRGKRERGDA